MRVKSIFMNVLVKCEGSKVRRSWLPGLWVGTDVPQGIQGAAGMLFPLGCGRGGAMIKGWGREEVRKD